MVLPHSTQNSAILEQQSADIRSKAMNINMICMKDDQPAHGEDIWLMFYDRWKGLQMILGVADYSLAGYLAVDGNTWKMDEVDNLLWCNAISLDVQYLGMFELT